MSNKTRELDDLTQGNLFKKLILYAIPIVLTLIIGALFNTADLLTVSRFSENGANKMASIGTNNAPINLLLGLFLGLGSGANVVAGNAKGCNDRVRAFKTTQSSVLLGILAGVLIAVLGYFTAEPLLILMNCEEVILDDAVLYLRVYCLGAPFNLVYNFGASILRAYGDSRRPLICLLISGLINICLNLFFVLVLRLDVLGVAIATITSQLIGALSVLYFLKTDKQLFVNFRFDKIKFYKEETLEVLKLGFSAGLSSLCFNITNVVIQSAVNSFGAAVVAGNTASSNIEGYQYFFITALSVTTLSFIAQNNGARIKENILKVFKYSLVLQFLVNLVVGTLLFALRYQLLDLYVGKNETEYQTIIDAGLARIVIIAFTYFLFGFCDTFSSYYRGLKFAIFPTIVNIFGIVGLRIIFITTIFQMKQFHTLEYLYLSWPISWVLTTVVFAIFFKKKTHDAFEGYKKPIEYAIDTRKLHQ